jgi:DNA-binding GntR family transcriptional regulator
LRAIAADVEQLGSDPVAAIALNRNFHVSIAELCGNQHLVSIIGRVLDDSERIFHIGIGSFSVEEMLRTHFAMVDALRAGDLDRVLASIEKEAYGTRERVIASLMSPDRRAVGIDV